MTKTPSPSRARLVLATLNPAKVQELKTLLGDVPFEVLPLSAFPEARLPAEGDSSYADNALTKARAAAALGGTLALADDSGLEVDALGGRPGVSSARYGGPMATDTDRCALLLEALRDVPASQRSARLRCVIALADPAGQERVVEGVVEGSIASSPRGRGGFGYDPVFIYSPLDQTFGELAAEVKNRVSHRARAALLTRQLLSDWPWPPRT